MLLLAYFSLDGRIRGIYIRLKCNNQKHVKSLCTSVQWLDMSKEYKCFFFEGSDKEVPENLVEAANAVARLSSH